MQWVKSGIENPSKSEVIGRCGGDERTRMATQNRQKADRQKTKKTKTCWSWFEFELIYASSTSRSCITI